MQEAPVCKSIIIHLLWILIFSVYVPAVAANQDVLFELEQAPDLGCDNSLDGPYSTSAVQIEPINNCVKYRLTATNIGLNPIHNVVVRDYTPSFTVYQSVATCSSPGCLISEPSHGGTGMVTGKVNVLNPGEKIELVFAVMIE